ncbi:MAG: SPOR domain-containing protein [Alphaproteobacteria bacterium]|nr:SPOR domain-containing protein [Alphaproteobacteria bacterium]
MRILAFITLVIALAGCGSRNEQPLAIVGQGQSPAVEVNQNVDEVELNPKEISNPKEMSVAPPDNSMSTLGAHAESAPSELAPIIHPDVSALSPAPVVRAPFAHLESYRTREAAQKASEHLSPSVLNGRPVKVEQVDLGHKGIWYRVLIGGFISKTEVTSFCKPFRKRHADCVMVYSNDVKNNNAGNNLTPSHAAFETKTKDTGSSLATADNCRDVLSDEKLQTAYKDADEFLKVTGIQWRVEGGKCSYTMDSTKASLKIARDNSQQYVSFERSPEWTGWQMQIIDVNSNVIYMCLVDGYFQSPANYPGKCRAM